MYVGVKQDYLPPPVSGPQNGNFLAMLSVEIFDSKFFNIYPDKRFTNTLIPMLFSLFFANYLTVLFIHIVHQHTKDGGSKIELAPYPEL